MSEVISGRVTKVRRSRRLKDVAVLRMMAIMTDGNSEEVPKEFLETGRTGRRNAMPDILSPQGAAMSTADLPDRLEQLATTVHGADINSEAADATEQGVKRPLPETSGGASAHHTEQLSPRNPYRNVEKKFGLCILLSDSEAQPSTSKTEIAPNKPDDTKKCS